MLKKVLTKSWATTQDSGLKAGEKSFDGNTEVRHLMLGKGVKCIIIEETSENPTVFLKILTLLALKVRDVHLSICPISYKRISSYSGAHGYGKTVSLFVFINTELTSSVSFKTTQMLIVTGT